MMINNWSTPMPEMAMLLAIPTRSGYQRLISTPIGVMEVPALPIAAMMP